MNQCKSYKSLAWLFFGLVMIESLYTGLRFGCWLGFIACLMGFMGGMLYGRLKRNVKSTSCNP